MKQRLPITLTAALSLMFHHDTGAQTNPAATQAANAVAAQAALERQQQDASTVRSLLGLDPARIATIGLWPGPIVPCKLPKREKPYECQRILTGPAIVLSRLEGEFVVALGDQAIAQGKRSWWSNWQGAPLALAPGEVLYHVGNSLDYDKDLVATVYRP
jgi:hypothetical protein